MMTPKPELMPEGARIVEWKLTPEIYAHHLDWRQWPPGPWDDEPDRIEWRQEGSPLPRLMVRGPMGAWCGYVGLPEGHPLHGRKAWGTGGNDEQTSDIVDSLNVHCGITYADACAGNICHVPSPGEPDHVWWLGFDCAHARDVTPGLLRIGGRDFPAFEGSRYRDVWFVSHEVEKLALQLEATGLLAEAKGTDTPTPEVPT